MFKVFNEESFKSGKETEEHKKPGPLKARVYFFGSSDLKEDEAVVFDISTLF